MRNYILSELKKTWIWCQRIVSILGQWIFQMFMRLVAVCAVLYFLGGGCLLKGVLKPNELSPKENSAVPAPPATPHLENERVVAVYPKRPETLQTQIRSGASDLRSWNYTLRSIKYDIERWFRK